MAKSITSINSLLVAIKTANHSLQITLQKQGFNIHLSLGSEQEYTVKTLINSINTLAIQLLTITANRNQFIQRTSFNERIEIESCLKGLLNCLQQTTGELEKINLTAYQCDNNLPLLYTDTDGQPQHLKLLDAVHFIELIKPYCRILESITNQERILELSAILETVISKTQLLNTEKEQTISAEQNTELNYRSA